MERNEKEEQAIRRKEENDPLREVGDIVNEIAGEINGHLRGESLCVDTVIVM